jgi:hypothetical protein
MVYVKKMKIVILNALFLALNYLLFTHFTCYMTRRLIMKWLCGHVAHEDMRANFLVLIFFYFKIHILK